MVDINKKKKPHYDINWYADKYQSVLVWRNWLLIIVLLCLLGVLAMTLLMHAFVPTKTVKPFVIQIDEQTGVTEVVTGKKYKEYTANEALIKFFSMRYIYARENYNFQFVQENDEVIRVMSAPEVYLLFKQEVDAENPESPFVRFGTRIVRKVTLKSFSFIGNDTKKGESTVQAVLYVSEISQNRYPRNYFVRVTLNCGFNSLLELKEDERLINPLGYQVLGYRVDPES